MNPKVIVLMAGTNNVGTRTPAGDDRERVADITRGIEAIVADVPKEGARRDDPLMGITPRNDDMAVMPTIDGINARLARLANGRSIRFLNLNPRLADLSGKLVDGMTDPDKLHLTSAPIRCGRTR